MASLQFVAVCSGCYCQRGYQKKESFQSGTLCRRRERKLNLGCVKLNVEVV